MHALLLALCLAMPAAAQDVLRVGDFSSALPGQRPAGWEPLTFSGIERQTEYRVLRENGGPLVIRADSRAAASALVRTIRIDPSVYPIVSWRWKVEGVIPGSDPRRKSGDDYPARLYLTFDVPPDRLGFGERLGYEAARLLYGSPPPLAALNYIWARDETPGEIIPNAYTHRARMIVVRSGPALAGQWLEETRDVREDYRRAFGEEPPPITGVAIMTDTDDTGGRATAWYGDIVFHKASASPSGASCPRFECPTLNHGPMLFSRIPLHKRTGGTREDMPGLECFDICNGAVMSVGPPIAAMSGNRGTSTSR